jgi:hypothetical protein
MELFAQESRDLINLERVGIDADMCYPAELTSNGEIKYDVVTVWKMLIFHGNLMNTKERIP